MKKSFNILAIITVAVIAATGLAASLVDSNNNLMTADALPDPNCTKISENPDRYKTTFHWPQGLPSDRELMDNYVDIGYVDLFFAKGPMCEDDTTQTYADGLIRYSEASTIGPWYEVEIAGGEERFRELVETTHYPDRVSLGTINGLPALFIEPGIRNTLIVDDDTNEVLETIPNDSPGEIRVVDQENGRYYSIIADLPIDQLKVIMENTIP